mgnify:CR=1 FL=1
MKYFFNLIYLFIAQKWDTSDRWLCRKLPWFLRLPWCSLWVRQDEFHPSLDSDGFGLLSKVMFLRKLLKMWLNITRLRPNPTKKDAAIESLMLLDLEKCLRDEYSLNLVCRREIAHQRDVKNPSLS